MVKRISAFSNFLMVSGNKTKSHTKQNTKQNTKPNTKPNTKQNTKPHKKLLTGKHTKSIKYIIL